MIPIRIVFVVVKHRCCNCETGRPADLMKRGRGYLQGGGGYYSQVEIIYDKYLKST